VLCRSRRRAQGYVVAGLTVLILMAVMFSKNHPKPTATGTASSSTTLSTDVNQQKIHELEQDLSADQRQSQQQQTLKENAAGPPAGNASSAQANGMAPATQSPSATEPPRDPIADAEKALAFKARFASNLVSGNDTVPGEASSAHVPASATGTASANNSATSSIAPASQHSDTDAKRAPEVNVNSAHGQPYVLFEGMTIDTALVIEYRGKLAADGPRYKALGNSMAVPVMRWIGERIAAAVCGCDIPTPVVWTWPFSRLPRTP
jgi:site-specific DNA-cytosine methylase